MRIWMLASLLFAVTAIGGDRGMETSSRFFDRVIATSSRSNPFNEFQQTESAAAERVLQGLFEGQAVWGYVY